MTIKDTRAVKHDVSRKPLATSANRRWREANLEFLLKDKAEVRNVYNKHSTELLTGSGHIWGQICWVWICFFLKMGKSTGISRSFNTLRAPAHTLEVFPSFLFSSEVKRQ